MRATWYRLASLALIVLSSVCPGLQAKDKKGKVPAAPKDEIQVVGHIDLTGAAVTKFFITQHYSSSYLYAERGAGDATTLVDVTKPDKPLLLGNMALSSGSESLTLVAGTAALVSTASPAPSAPSSAPQTIRIMDLSDPKNPKVAREFTGVTSMARDDRRGLVFVADGAGIWILQQRLATDPEVEKAYANYVFYYH